MVDFFLKLYDFFQQHKRILWGALVALTTLLLVLLASLKYNENIYDFLPFADHEKKAMDIYQELSHSDRIVVLFHLKDSTTTNEYRLAEAVDSFAQVVTRHDSEKLIHNLVTQVDFDKISQITDFVYDNIPILLTDSDYVAMEQLLAQPDYVQVGLSNDMQMMLLPTTSAFTTNISKDPIGLFAPVIDRLQSLQSSMPFAVDDGYIFTPDHRYALAMLNTPFGAIESANNARLVRYVEQSARAVADSLGDVDFTLTGAPVIAVGNAQQIKHDSFLAIAIAVTLILALLMFSFRSFKSLFFIGVAIVFGWLFAMGGIALLSDNVSLIVIGIGSMIIGIAANYPLHFVAHGEHASDMRQVLKDMVAPLLIGNVTTVGAFACLIPLDAPALHDLGTFAALMLVGTILFVLIFLPHLFKVKHTAGQEKLPFGKVAAKSPDGQYWILAVVAVITLILGYFSLHTSFDTNMQSINYMTAEQKQILSKLAQAGGVMDKNVYLVTEGATWDQALAKRQALSAKIDSLQATHQVKMGTAVTPFVSSQAEQQRRIQLWTEFWQRHRDQVVGQLKAQAPAFGFSDEAFSDFYALLSATYTPHDVDYFAPLTTTLLQSSFCHSGDKCSLVETLNIPPQQVEQVEQAFNGQGSNDIYTFDIQGLNSSVANSLSDNFNYIGIACGFIVFFFLWLSFGRLELSLLAFLPMGVGWIWILGIMQLLGMQFNIVNVILATFIFGQGDDYTIFITDGLINEFAYRKKLLPSYKNSIIISALIMFIGMGALIVAKHPALHSLAEVTIVGMLTVVMMAWLLPPLIFGWLTHSGKRIRRVPITIEQVARTGLGGLAYIVELAVGATLGFVLFKVLGGGQRKQQWFHRLIHRVMRFNITHIPGIHTQVLNRYGEDFTKGSIVVANHQSIIDPVWLMSLSPNIVVVMGERVGQNPLLYHTVRFANYVQLSGSLDSLATDIAQRIDQGYNVVIFPEGARYDDDQIHRFHKGAFALASKIGADILPIYLHGTGHVMGKSSGLACRGHITVDIGQRIAPTSEVTYQALTKQVHQLMQAHYGELRRELETSHYYHDYVVNKYLYKGASIERDTHKQLKAFDDYSQWIDHLADDVHSVIVLNAGCGQFSLLLALVNPQVQVWSLALDEDDATLAACCDPLPSNLQVTHYQDSLLPRLQASQSLVYLLAPTPELTSQFAAFHPIAVTH